MASETATSVSDAISAAAAAAAASINTQTRFSFYDAQEVELQISASEHKEQDSHKERCGNNKDGDSRLFHFFEETERHELAAVENKDFMGTTTNTNTNTTATTTTTTSSTDSTEDILRSLQETEEQRRNILKEVEHPHPHPHSHPHSHSHPPRVPQPQRVPQRTPKLNAADLTVLTTSSTSTSISNSNSNSKRTPQGGGGGGDENGSNPYEDAIKEALDLLRKHRSPPATPTHYSTSPRNNNNTVPVEDTPGSSRPRTPRDQDRLLQHRMDDHDEDDDDTHDHGAKHATPSTPTEDLTDVYEEHKLKAKLRQERMAKYASRLQEFKSSLPAENMEQYPQISNTQSNIEANMVSDTQPAQQIPHVSSTNEDSIGFSDLSQSTKKVEDEVQRGVERVLLAILERANASRGRAESLSYASEPSLTSAQLDQQDSINDALLRAMDDLGFGQQQQQQSSSSSGEDSTTNVKTNTSSDSATHLTHLSKRSTQTERSVVDELLAEVEYMDEHQHHHHAHRHPATTPHNESNSTLGAAASPSSNHAMFGQPAAWPREEKKLPDSHEKTTAPAYGTIQEEDLVADQLMEQCLRSSSNEQGDGDSSNDNDENDDENDSYVETEDEESQNDTTASNLEGVLGPLSNGRRTGVVLDSMEQEQTTTGGGNNVKKSSSTPEHQENNTKTLLGRYPSSEDKYSTDETEDVEATELMRTLCAHLLPYGVDQSNELLEAIPDWDEANSSEAGYRIIRLSKPQLRRVERAFETMINGLKLNSERRLNGGVEAESSADANFVRELQEAERLLDDEEKRLKAVETAQTMTLNRKSATTSTKPRPQDPASLNLEDPQAEAEEDAEEDGHPDFPGVKATGKGEMGDLEYFHLPIVFKSHVTGFEPTKNMVLEPGNVVAGQYLVESELGTAAFSTAYRCIDLSSERDDGHEEVCLKVIKNTKDFFDQSLDEIKILELLRQTGKNQENHILEMKCFFYYREHLIIVTELLRQNLFEFGKFILDNNEEPYFTISRLAYMTRQALISLRFVHSLGLVHSDVKPENILLGSYSRAQIKLIDFGSSCYLTDRQSSYIQSRSYRAPEVVLGLPYDGKIDVWSLGCVVAEMFTGEVTFQNDSIVSMLSRIEAICGPFPRHMIAQGRQSGRFFTKSGLLYEVVGDSDPEGKSAPGPHEEDTDNDETDTVAQFDIFQPKTTRLSSRLGFDADLMDDFSEDDYRTNPANPERQEQQMFVDFCGKLLTIDADGRPSAEEALKHPWMLYAASLTEEQVKYPSS